MPFECGRCGECCSAMGPVHRIEQVSGSGFLLRNCYSGDITKVAVDPDKAGLFADAGIFQKYPNACPFFRLDDTGKACCTVHSTWPAICEEFRCWKVLISSPEGERIGRIFYSRTLLSEDAGLRQFWDRCCSDIHSVRDDRVWEDKMSEKLQKAGYVIRK